ncbi:hypothetical protein [Zooshikella harenae]|uniref:Uncharacterized protein n=1 Tax=Zooshikella harenae TaxID=2827238 RepID=A0ABS5ZLU4_9GAMM|nr:hypothetical protein [Zooshikella harenae]MBU2714450.1 hypothetical protein [Zooshikella harenae]
MSKREIKFLNCMIQKYEQEQPRSFIKKLLGFIACLLLGAGVGVLYSLNKHGHVDVIYLVAASALLGAYISFISIVSASAKNWPFLKKHLNIKSMKQRIEDLNA